MARVHRLALAVAAGAAALGVAASVSLAGRDVIPFFPAPDDVVGEPVQVGPRVLLAEGDASGSHWTLSAYRSDQGLCVDLGFENSLGGGCGSGVRGDPGGGGSHWVGFGSEQFGTSSSVFVYAPAARGVASVELELAGGGRAETRMIEGPAELGAPLDFYFATLESSARVHAVVARGRSGALLERRVVDL